MKKLQQQMLKLQTKPNRLYHRLAHASLFVLSLVTLSACQSTSGSSPVVLTEQPLSPESQPIPYRTEIAIARISELLTTAELKDEQRARLFYDRGVMFDSAGLPTLARLDFMRALRLKPDMADAYNIIGIHHSLAGDFEQAYEAFDSVLELDVDYEYAYLNRGIALQYDGKIDLAIADFLQFHQRKPEDPYRVLWLYFAELEQSKTQADLRLTQLYPQLDQSAWARHIVAFFLGHITEAELLKQASTDVTDPQQLAEQLCEVYFYLAKWHSLQQNPTLALEYYKKTLATNVYEFVEYRYARVEMQLLRQQYGVTTHTADDEEPHAH
jgi:lipoprotein NlpI